MEEYREIISNCNHAATRMRSLVESLLLLARQDGTPEIRRENVDLSVIVSDWQPQQRFNPGDKTKLWGSFGYTKDKDVVRAPMTRYAAAARAALALAWSAAFFSSMRRTRASPMSCS